MVSISCYFPQDENQILQSKHVGMNPKYSDYYLYFYKLLACI